MFSEIIKNKKLTISDISKGANIPRSTVADLVNGKTSVEKMSSANLKKLSTYLGCKMDDVFEYCILPEITNEKAFAEQENSLIINCGLKKYINNLEENNLVETTYLFGDYVRFRKYTEALRNFYKYRRISIPERYKNYIAIFENMEIENR